MLRQAVGAVDCFADLAGGGVEPGAAIANDREFILRSLRRLARRIFFRSGWLFLTNLDGFAALGAGPSRSDIHRFDFQADAAVRAGHRE